MGELFFFCNDGVDVVGFEVDVDVVIVFDKGEFVVGCCFG